jgi:hypothetical protein
MIFIIDFGLVNLLKEAKEQCNRNFNRNEIIWASLMGFEIGNELQFSYPSCDLFVSRRLVLTARFQNSNQNEFRRTEAITA